MFRNTEVKNDGCLFLLAHAYFSLLLGKSLLWGSLCPSMKMEIILKWLLWRWKDKISIKWRIKSTRQTFFHLFPEGKVQSILQSCKFLEQKLLLFLSKHNLHQAGVFLKKDSRDVGLRWEMAAGSPQPNPM